MVEKEEELYDGGNVDMDPGRAPAGGALTNLDSEAAAQMTEK
jgi:hypothetical protein